MSSGDATLGEQAGVPELVSSADTIRLLRAAEVDPCLARVLSFIERELRDRLRSDVEDERRSR